MMSLTRNRLAWVASIWTGWSSSRARAASGGRFRSEEGVPGIRRIREGRSADGRGWVGLWRREAYTVRDVSLSPLAPAWIVMLMAGALLVGAWRVEGR